MAWRRASTLGPSVGAGTGAGATARAPSVAGSANPVTATGTAENGLVTGETGVGSASGTATGFGITRAAMGAGGGTSFMANGAAAKDCGGAGAVAGTGATSLTSTGFGGSRTATGAGASDAVITGSALCLMLGPGFQPVPMEPNGEIDGAPGWGFGAEFPEAGAEGDEEAGRAGGAEGLAEAGVGDPGREPGPPEATPLSSSSKGRRRCAWTSLSRPSSKWKRCS